MGQLECKLAIVSLLVSRLPDDTDADGLLVGCLPLHAVRRTAPEAGDAHLQGQVLDHG